MATLSLSGDRLAMPNYFATSVPLMLVTQLFYSLPRSVLMVQLALAIAKNFETKNCW